MFNLFIKTRILLGVLGLLLVGAAYYLYGLQHDKLWLLALPLVTMQRRRWSDTHHTMFVWFYGALGLVSLIFWMVINLADKTIADFMGANLLQAYEFSLITTLILWVATFVHLAFAIVERHDEPEDFGQ